MCEGDKSPSRQIAVNCAVFFCINNFFSRPYGESFIRWKSPFKAYYIGSKVENSFTRERINSDQNRVKTSWNSKSRPVHWAAKLQTLKSDITWSRLTWLITREQNIAAARIRPAWAKFARLEQRKSQKTTCICKTDIIFEVSYLLYS